MQTKKAEAKSVSHLYEYIQSKNSKFSISDLKFLYEQNKDGLFNCIVKLDNKIYDNHLCCKSKKDAKNEIAYFVYEDLIKNSENIRKQKDNRNAIVKLNEFCQDKSTNIKVDDLKYIYETNKDGFYNCIITLKNNKIYNQNLSCKSKKEAKNKIAEFVYEDLTRNDKENNIFNEQTLSLLDLNGISLEDLINNIYECENNKYICIIEFKKLNNSFLSLYPKSIDEINKNFNNFINEVFLNKDNNSNNNKNNKINNNEKYTFKEYAKLNNIPYKYKIDVGKKNVKCIYSSLGIVIGEGKEKINENDDIKKIISNAKEKGEKKSLKTILNFITGNSESSLPQYKNDIEIKLDKKIIDNPLTESDYKYNVYMQNVTQNFISTFSKKEEKKYLSEINTIITETINKIKREKHISGSYLIKKINNHEIWNIINYEIIIYVEFRIDYLSNCFNEILNSMKEKLDSRIMVIEVAEESNDYEKIKRKPNKMRIRLKNGLTFSVYVGPNIYEKLLSRYVNPFKDCLDIERKYIQFVILWSNLILYQDFENKPSEGYSYYLEEQERIFTTLALYTYDYTLKYLNKNDNRKQKNIHILSFVNLIYMIINYKKMEICWYNQKRKSPFIIDPVTNKNLIYSKNNFMWKIYKEYCETIYDKNERKVKLIPDVDEIKFDGKNKIRIYFRPYVKYPNSFSDINSIYFKIIDDPEITIKSSLYQIHKDINDKNRLNVIFNSLQSFLLLNIYNSDNSIQIQNLNNEKNAEKFKELNKRLKSEVKYAIREFFKNLNPNILVNRLKPENQSKSMSNYEKSLKINKLYFILGNNVNICIDIVIQ